MSDIEIPRVSRSDRLQPRLDNVHSLAQLIRRNGQVPMSEYPTVPLPAIQNQSTNRPTLRAQPRREQSEPAGKLRRRVIFVEILA